MGGMKSADNHTAFMPTGLRGQEQVIPGHIAIRNLCRDLTKDGSKEPDNLLRCPESGLSSAARAVDLYSARRSRESDSHCQDTDPRCT